MHLDSIYARRDPPSGHPTPATAGAFSFCRPYDGSLKAHDILLQLALHPHEAGLHWHVGILAD